MNNTYYLKIVWLSRPREKEVELSNMTFVPVLFTLLASRLRTSCTVSSADFPGRFLTTSSEDAANGSNTHSQLSKNNNLDAIVD